MRYQAIIFDVSETLTQDAPSDAEVYGDRLRRLGLAVSQSVAQAAALAVNLAAGEQMWREQQGAPRIPDEEFEQLLNRAALLSAQPEGAATEALLARMSAMPRPQRTLVVMEGVLALLEHLKQCGYRLGIVSNQRATLLDWLQAVGLQDYFQTIIVSDVVGVAKPDPRIMHLALAALQLEAAACLYVGDHPLDVLCAKSAGLDCAWIAPRDRVLPPTIGYTEDLRLEHVTDLLHALG